MQKLKTYNKYWINASSLIESVIAITVIAVCLLIGIKIYASILNNTTSVNSLQIEYTISKLYNESVIKQEFENEFYDFKSFSIEKEVSNFNNNSQLKHILYKVSTSENTFSYNFLIVKKTLNDDL